MSAIKVADELRLPPQSIEAEQSVIGGLLLDNGAWDRIAGAINGEDFYRGAHREIFKTITGLIQTGQPADVLTVAETLERTGKLTEVGGQAYLGTLAANTPGAANIRRYAEIVCERATLRSLITQAQEAIDACTAPGVVSPAEIAARLEQAVAALSARRHRGEAVTLGEAVANAITHIDRLYDAGGGMAGVSTGLVDFDHVTGGAEPGDLWIIAGRPSMGKTALALTIAEHVAERHGSVGLFSLEMSHRQLAMRVIASRSRVPMNKLRTGRVAEEQWAAIAEVNGGLSDLPIFLDDTSAVGCAHIRARCRKIKREHGLALVIVDYLQLMRGEGDNRTQEVGSISRGLKAIAKDLEVPVIALSQLSRRVEERTDKRPVLSDLRDSGEIEQDADLIAFIYRDEVYRPDSPAKGTAELLIRKQRNGPTGDIRLTFLEETMRFENYAGPGIHLPPMPRSRPRGFDYKTAQSGE